MSDRDMEARVRSWARSAAEPIAPQELRRQVTSIPTTESATRPRPWTRFLPGLKPAAGADGRADRGPSHRSTDGHMPTPTGRTRTMFSATKLVAGAAILALSSGLLLSGVLTTSDPEDPLPAAPLDRTDFIIVTGTSTLSGGYTPSGDDSMSDPRVSGHANLVNNWQISDVDNTGVQWGQYQLTNDDGGWEGEWIGFYDSTTVDDLVGLENAMIWAAGTGDYEGWSYVANYTGELLDLDVRGLLYQGDIPPTVALGLLEADAQ